MKTRLEILCGTWGQTATGGKSEHTSLTRSVSQNEGDEMAGKHHATLRAEDVLCCDHAQDTDMCKCILNDTHATFAAYLQLTCKWRRAQVMPKSLHKWTLSCIELNVQCTEFARDKRGHPWRWLNPWAMTHIRRNTFSTRVINYWNLLPPAVVASHNEPVKKQTRRPLGPHNVFSPTCWRLDMLGWLTGSDTKGLVTYPKSILFK